MNPTRLKAGLISLIGWRQNYDNAGVQLTDMLSSTSGLYFNDIHPVLTIENLASVCPRFDLVNNNDQSAINQAFTQWLKERTEAGILKTLNDWDDIKHEFGTGVNLLHSSKLFEENTSESTLETNKNKTVGLEVSPHRSETESLVLCVDKIGIQLSQNQTLEIKVFQAGKKQEIYTETINYDQNGGIQWAIVNWEFVSGRNYFICYDQNNLIGQAVNGIYQYSYDDVGFAQFAQAKFFSALGFNVDGSNTELWDIKNNQYSVSTNYGLNLSVTAKCDYTNFVLQQAEIFKNAIWLGVGMELMRELAFNSSSRINRNESNITQRQILNEIDGDTQGNNSMSIYGRYRKALKSIQFDKSQIDKICLPCRRRGIKHRAIGTSFFRR